MNVLIVRLGALGDIVHTIPAAAAIRAAYPDARIDWLVDAKHRAILELVPVVDTVLTLRHRSLAGWLDATRQLRLRRYDVALDFQGLMKSALLARASGARRVLGFSIWHLREKGARPFYSESVRGDADPGEPLAGHVIRKNLRLLSSLGIASPAIEFPLRPVPSAARDAIAAQASGRPYALLNPGAAWPNKRWPAARFGEIAAFLRDVRRLHPIVLWGPGEEGLAADVIAASSGAATLAPPTAVADLVSICRDAALMISGDTGPLHVAAAVGTPIVAIFGPTDPERNGPFASDDVHVSRYASCGCHYDRRCHQASWCLQGIQVPEVAAAVQQRLSHRHV